MVWSVLAVIVALGFTLALALRPPQENPQAPPAQSEPRK
jgi:hypothetical protein